MKPKKRNKYKEKEMNGLIYERFGIFNDYDGFVEISKRLKQTAEKLHTKANFNYY